MTEFIIANEFASVKLGYRHTRNGVGLWLHDRFTNQERMLDALELEGLVWANEDILRTLIDPAMRWVDQAPDAF